jgi:hypothetical protein
LKPSNSVEALGKTAQQKQPSDYEDIHWIIVLAEQKHRLGI